MRHSWLRNELEQSFIKEAQLQGLDIKICDSLDCVVNDRFGVSRFLVSISSTMILEHQGAPTIARNVWATHFGKLLLQELASFRKLPSQISIRMSQPWNPQPIVSQIFGPTIIDELRKRKFDPMPEFNLVPSALSGIIVELTFSQQ